MKRCLALVFGLALAGCSTTYEVPAPAETGPLVPGRPAPGGSARTSGDFGRVALRVEPVAERFCREEIPQAPAGYCDFVIMLEDDPRMPPNAFQTRGRDGRPVVVVSTQLVGQMRSNDEIAFVLAHEAAHHIAEHIPRQQQSQMLGALILGGMVAAAGQAAGTPVSQDAIREAMDVGAFVGGRVYSQDYELEADWLGAFITARAGYDPERGAQIFGRPALSGSGGPVILSSHPGSPQRLALVAQAADEIRRQQAAGQVPRPGRVQ
jgi:Zn-dependent protease with chaperone function